MRVLEEGDEVLERLDAGVGLGDEHEAAALERGDRREVRELELHVLEQKRIGGEGRSAGDERGVAVRLGARDVLSTDPCALSSANFETSAPL